MIRPPSFCRTTPQAKPSSLKARCQNKSTLTAISKRERWKKKPASPPPTGIPIFMVNWATAIRMKCLKIPIAIFPSRAQVRNTAENIARAFLLGACFLSVLPGAAAASSTFHHVRLSPGPRLVGTRADRSGSGSVTATLEDNTLKLQGSFSGLLAVPTGAHLHMGSLPGVRGPRIADLSVSPDTTGTLSGTVQLNSPQLLALRKGGLYIEIDSDKAPEGDLWGWIMP
jgi:hypothetical protein